MAFVRGDGLEQRHFPLHIQNQLNMWCKTALFLARIKVRMTCISDCKYSNFENT